MVATVKAAAAVAVTVVAAAAVAVIAVVATGLEAIPWAPAQASGVATSGGNPCRFATTVGSEVVLAAPVEPHMQQQLGSFGNRCLLWEVPVQCG